MKKRRFVKIVLVIMIFCGIVSACGKKEEITGQWKEENGSEILELFSDGTGTVKDDDGIEYSLTWIAENERLKISVDFGFIGEQTVTYDYKINSSSLILSDEEGEETIYIK